MREAVTWDLVLGLGLVGLAMRRRNR